MNDDSHPTTNEIPDAPAPSHRRHWYIGATVVVIALIAALATSSRPKPLSPMEAHLVGTWDVVDGDGRLASHVTYCSDRTSFEPLFPGTPDSLVLCHRWKIEDGRLIVSRIRTRWKDVVHAVRRHTIFSPETHDVPIEFLSEDKIRLHGPAGPTLIRTNEP